MSDTAASDTSLQDALALLGSGRFDEAVPLFHGILRTDPRHFEALSSLGRIYFDKYDYDRAQYLLGEALLIDPFFTDGLCLRGVALLKLNRKDQALECFERALMLKPDFVEALSNRATALLEMARYEDALAGFDATLAVNPAHAETWNNRGNTLLALKRTEDAMASYEKALELNPDLVEAVQNRAETLGALCGTGSPYADFAFARGLGLMSKNRFLDAIAQFNEAVLVRPNFPDAYTAHAAALAALDRLDEALGHCEVATTLDPAYAPAFELRGDILHDLGRPADAVASYDQALAIDDLRPGLAAKRERIQAGLAQTTT